MRHSNIATLLAALLFSGCAAEPAFELPEDPIDPGKGDGVANPSPHFTAVTTCDNAWVAADGSAEAIVEYWRCVMTANEAAAVSLDATLDNNVPGELADLETDFEELCKGAALRSTNPAGIEPLCGMSMTRQLATLIDAFAKFGKFDRVANDPDRTFTAACYERYSADIVKATTTVRQAEISSDLAECVDNAIDDVLATKINPGLATAGVSEDEGRIIAAAFQHINVRARSLCSSFGESIAPPGSFPGSTAFRVSVTDRCATDTKNAALTTLVFFHDRFADRVPTRAEFTASPDLAIPDAADRGVDVDLVVTGVAAPKALTVALDITHPFPADLVIELRKDERTVKTLLDHDDNAPIPLQSTYQLTADEVGEPNGTWTLHVVDEWAVDEGRIKSVTLSFE